MRPLLEAGVKVTINSDDPAYFFLGAVDAQCYACDDTSYDGFIASNYLWTACVSLPPPPHHRRHCNLHHRARMHIAQGRRGVHCSIPSLSLGAARSRTCGLTPDDCVIIARNSLEACFVDDDKKADFVEKLRKYCDGWRPE